MISDMDLCLDSGIFFGVDSLTVLDLRLENIWLKEDVRLRLDDEDDTEWSIIKKKNKEYVRNETKMSLIYNLFKVNYCLEDNCQYP